MGAVAGRPSGVGSPRGATQESISDERVIAVDLGGTYLRAALADGEGRVFAKRRVKTLAHEGRDAVLERIFALLGELEAEAGGSVVAAIGIGAPGPLDSVAGIVKRAPTLPGWTDVPLAGIVEERVGVPVVLVNDANAAALGELAHGAGRGAGHLVYLTVSTGIGGGVVVAGEILEGWRGAAGEVGHIVVEPGGPVCPCGGRGHLEAVASGTAIARQAREAVAAGEETMISSMADGDPENVTAKLVYEAALRGDRLGAGLLAAAGGWVGHALVSLVHLFDPEVIVLGGGVTGAGDLFWGPLREVLREDVSPAFGEGLRLEKSTLGDDAGLYGAAALALRAVRDPGTPGGTGVLGGA